jgi:predicted nucleic acid-binding protein
MNLIIDTNIVFSTLLNPNSNIGDLVLNYQDSIQFFAPELLIEEINRYSDKIEKYSKLNPTQLSICKFLLLNAIQFVSEDLISDESWSKAYHLTKDIDENDTPFVALAIQMNAKLWSGDKKLTTGLVLKKSELIFTTQELKNLLSL